MPIVTLQQDSSHYVSLEVTGRMHPNHTPIPGPNWLKVRVQARARDDSYDYVAELEIHDLREFLNGLVEGPYEDEESVGLVTLEGGIYIDEPRWRCSPPGSLASQLI